MKVSVNIGDKLIINMPDNPVLHTKEVTVTDVHRFFLDANDVMGIEFQFRPDGGLHTFPPEQFFWPSNAGLYSLLIEDATGHVLAYTQGVKEHCEDAAKQFPTSGWKVHEIKAIPA